MSNYNRDNRGEGGSRFKSGNSSYRGDFKRKTFGDRGDSGFKKSFGGNRGFNDRSYEKKEMFDTVCDECGRECKVPFRPSNDKPIFCSDCFEKRGGNDKKFDERNERSDRSYAPSAPRQTVNNTEVLEQLAVLNEKIEQILKSLSKITKDSAPREDAVGFREKAKIAKALKTERRAADVKPKKASKKAKAD